jgi:hypothetical protein
MAEMLVNPDSPLRPGESRWEWLPNGVQCRWRVNQSILVWHVLILTEFLALLVLLMPDALSPPVGRARWALPVIMLYVGGMTVMFLFAVMRGFRNRRHPNLLKATADTLEYRPSLGRPLVIPRDAVIELSVEAVRWLPARYWRLIVRKRCGQRRRVLFMSHSRQALEATCRALRAGLRIPRSDGDSA